MVGVEGWAEIRRLHFVKGLSRERDQPEHEPGGREGRSDRDEHPQLSVHRSADDSDGGDGANQECHARAAQARDRETITGVVAEVHVLLHIARFKVAWTGTPATRAPPLSPG